MTVLEYLIRLRGAPEAIAEADAVAASQDRIAGATRRVGTESGIASSMFGKSIGHMKALALGVGGVLLGGLAAFAGFEAVKSTVESTGKLAVSAGALSKTTGMNISTAAQWLSIAQAYGLAGRTMTMSFRTLATQTESARGGSKKAKDAFDALGISSKQLGAHSKDMNGLLGLVADRLNKMPGGTQKTQIAAQLLGRGWQQLMPVLGQGSKGMDDLRRTAAAYGVTLGGDPLKNVQKLHEAQVKLKLAQIGLQIQVAEKLAPAFLALVGFGLKLYHVLATNLGPAFHFVSDMVKDASKWISKHKDLAHALAVGLGILVGALAAVRLAMLLVNLMMLASPIGWIILGIAALVAALVYCWTHFKTFRDVVTAVFDAVKGAAIADTKWIINAFNNVVDFFSKLPGRISSAASGLWDGLKSGLIDVVNWIIGIWNGLPFIHGFHVGPLHVPGLGMIAPIGQGPAVTGAATHAPSQSTANLPHGRGAVTGVPHNAAMASDIHIHIDGREIAHVTRRQIIRAMAANA